MNREIRWMIAASIVVALEYAVATAIGLLSGFHFELPTKTYAIVTATIAACTLLGLLLLRLAQYGLCGEQHPTRRLISDARTHGPWLISISAAFVLCGLQIAALTWLKMMLPISQGFWADPILADADKLLLGRDPWIVTHALLGSANAWLDRLYVTWMPIKFVALVLVILAPLSDARARGLLSYFIIMATGSLGQYLLPSGGPVFYKWLGYGPRFDELPIEPWVETARNYLWADYLHPNSAIGAGISAMPSMHVAIALWVVLVLGSYSRRLQWIGWAWFTTILIGSVHLGWHYLLDGIAAIVIGLLAYWIAGKVIERPRQSSGLVAQLT